MPLTKPTAISVTNQSTFSSEVCYALNQIVNIKSAKILYECLCENLLALLQADRVAVYRYDPHLNKMWCPKSIGLSKTFINFVKKQYEALPGFDAISFDDFRVIDDVEQEPSLQPFKKLILEEAGKTIIFFPMIQSDDSIGIIALYFIQQKQVDVEQLQMIQTIARIGGSTLQRIHLLHDTQAALEREKKLNEINSFLNSAQDLPTILLAVVRKSAELIHADAGLLGVLIDAEMMTFYPHMVPAHIPLKPAAKGRGVAWRIVETGKPVITNDYFSLERSQDKWMQVGISAFVGVPLLSGEERLGVITLFRYGKNSKSFSQRDLAAVQMIAQQAATTIKNMRLLSEANHRANALSSTLNRQEELDKLKNQFIHTASHELRSPLGIIFGHAELLESGVLGELQSEQMDSVVIIGRRVRMLTDLVNDLTALLAAETQELRRELINTSLFVQALQGDHAIRAKELGIELQFQLEDSLPYLHGDQTHLQRVFDNLFSNAFKFTKRGGTIRLQINNVEENVRFVFSDTGEGIDPQQLPRIFERFYQVRTKGKPKKFGTGLGLALVKEIIHAHRGSVSAASELGVGTTFTILLPGHPPPQM